MVMENRPVDPGSIQGSHRPISFVRIKHRTRANDNLCKYLMYHAACKVEFQPFTRSYSQLTFFNFLYKSCRARPPALFHRQSTTLCPLYFTYQTLLLCTIPRLTEKIVCKCSSVVPKGILPTAPTCACTAYQTQQYTGREQYSTAAISERGSGMEGRVSKCRDKM